MAHAHQPTPDQLVDPDLLSLNPRPLRPLPSTLQPGSSSSTGPATTDLGRRPSYQHADSLPAYGDQQQQQRPSSSSSRLLAVERAASSASL